MCGRSYHLGTYVFTLYVRNSVAMSVGLVSARVGRKSFVALLPKAVVRFCRRGRGIYLKFIKFSSRYLGKIGLVRSALDSFSGVLRCPMLTIGPAITSCFGSCFTL